MHVHFTLATCHSWGQMCGPRKSGRAAKPNIGDKLLQLVNPHAHMHTCKHAHTCTQTDYNLAQTLHIAYTQCLYKLIYSIASAI